MVTKVAIIVLGDDMSRIRRQQSTKLEPKSPRDLTKPSRADSYLASIGVPVTANDTQQDVASPITAPDADDALVESEEGQVTLEEYLASLSSDITTLAVIVDELRSMSRNTDAREKVLFAVLAIQSGAITSMLNVLNANGYNVESEKAQMKIASSMLTLEAGNQE